jgi:hypothetical protein
MPVIVNTLMHACNENEMYELSLSLSKDNYCIMDVPLDTKYYTVDDINAIDYYITETENWIKNNDDIMKNFCAKLMVNKGYDASCIFGNIEEKDIDIVEIGNELTICDDICDDIERKLVITEHYDDIQNNIMNAITDEIIDGISIQC